MSAAEIDGFIELLSDLGNRLWNAGVPVDVVTIAGFFTTRSQFERHIAFVRRRLAQVGGQS